MERTYDDKYFRELAERIYDLDTEVYEAVGSSLGRVFNGSKERMVSELMKTMMVREQGYLIRSELALISNMARTITNKPKRKEIMIKYDALLKELMELPTSFAAGDILDSRMAGLNVLNLKERFGEKQHVIVCISRTFGSAGSEIGFTLADELQMNFYDVSIMDEVLKRLETEDGTVISQDDLDRQSAHRNLAKEYFDNFRHYHGIPKRDAEFFLTSKLILQKAREEDFIIMGRCADAILSNHNIPHISIFITAPTVVRLHRIMEINPHLDAKAATKLMMKQDAKHMKRYHYYTGRTWGKASNYDLCINSGTYGIRGCVDMIKSMFK